MATKWGQGYAWSPVGFIERIKDPNDVELAREGYTMVAPDFIRNFANDGGGLKTVAFTPVLLPVGTQTNHDFGKPNQVSAAAKLCLLYFDTDIDLTWLGVGSRSPRVSIDFSRNLSSALEIHGAWARLRDVETRRIDAAGNVSTDTRDATSYLLGLRYRYLRARQKEPFDIVYFTPSATLIANLDDRSWSLTPELLYTGITNPELRLRAAGSRAAAARSWAKSRTRASWS